MVRDLKRLKSSEFVRVKAFPMNGGIGVSAPSLHRESTDSLIYRTTGTIFLYSYNTPSSDMANDARGRVAPEGGVRIYQPYLEEGVL